MKNIIACVLLLTGCSESATELTAWQKSMRDGSAEAVEVAKQVEKKQDASIVILRDHTAALLRIETKLEASLSAPKPNGEEVIKSAPNPPAKANTQVPLKVATPGDSSEPETLVELATRLYSRGVNVHNKTEDELRAIDAQLNGGQAVSGAMFPNNGASAITSKRSAVRFVPRGSSFVQWQNNSTQQSCGPNGCTPRRSR